MLHNPVDRLKNVARRGLGRQTGDVLGINGDNWPIAAACAALLAIGVHDIWGEIRLRARIRRNRQLSVRGFPVIRPEDRD